MADQSPRPHIAWKVHQVIALFVLLAGFAWTLFGPESQTVPGTMVGPALLVLGTVWFVATRVLFWWAHQK
jgi:hypothetical protein